MVYRVGIGHHLGPDVAELVLHWRVTCLRSGEVESVSECVVGEDIRLGAEVPNVTFREYSGRTLKTKNSTRVVSLVGDALWGRGVWWRMRQMDNRRDAGIIVRALSHARPKRPVLTHPHHVSFMGKSSR